MENSTVSATDFQQAVGAYFDEAARGPVVVTKHGRPTRVLLDVQEYERLVGLANRQASIHTPSLAEVIKAVKSARGELEKKGVEHVAVFGSVARGEERPGSDVDLLVSFKKGKVIGFELVGVQEFLSHILGAKVDIVRAPIKNSSIRREIERDKVVVY